MSTIDNVKKQHSEAMKSVYGYDDGYIDEETKSIMESMSIEVVDESYFVKSQFLDAQINVYGREKDIPHFHVYYGGNKETCICIFEAMYANHEPNHTTMTSKQLQALNIFMMSPDRESKTHKESYWLEIARQWNLSNPKFAEDLYKDGKLRKPDYSKTFGNAKIGKKYKEK